MRKALGTLLLFNLLLAGPSAAPVNSAELWVSPEGANHHPGTREKPLASVVDALRQVRELRRLGDASVENGARIILRDGVYPLTSPLLVRPEDSGTEDAPTIIQAAPGERPVLSGGIEIGPWKRLQEQVPGLPDAANESVWVTDAPRVGGRIIEFRQLWVNNAKAVRAREPNGNQMARLVDWDRTNQLAWIPASISRPFQTFNGMEMILLQMWEVAMLRIKSIGVLNDRASVTFHEPENRIQFEHPWPPPIISENGNSPFFLANAIEFLDQPGEWFQEIPGGRVLYWPREGEELNKSQVIVPHLETLMELKGSLDRPVSHVQFKGISFQHTTWMRPSESGHVPLQATMFLTDAYKLRPKGTPDWRSLDNQAWIGRPPAAVTVSGANRIRFERCRFEHLAATGLDFVSGTRDDVIEGNVFRDIGGNGIQMGSFQEGGIETHLPYEPADLREVCTREHIANNVVTDCANEDWGGVGICVGYGREINIEHNEVFSLSYTGISLGWGWTRTPNAMRGNRVHANHIHRIATRMADTAGVYTLSAQPWTVISDNHVHSMDMSPWVHDPDHWFYLYLDEGSSFITVSNNWCPSEKFLANANGPGNIWTNNGPMVSELVREAAGLEPEFRDLLEEFRTGRE